MEGFGVFSIKISVVAMSIVMLTGCGGCDRSYEIKTKMATSLDYCTGSYMEDGGWIYFDSKRHGQVKINQNDVEYIIEMGGGVNNVILKEKG